MRGNLLPGDLPQLLSDLYLGGKTGWLDLQQGEERVKVLFREGRIVDVSTRTPERPAPGPDDSSRLKLHRVLEELGIRRRQSAGRSPGRRDRLYQAFCWKDASYVFEEAESVPEADPGVQLSTEQAIVEAIHRIEDPGFVRKTLGDTQRVLVLCVDPASTLEEPTLTLTDGQILGLVDGTLSAQQVLESVPGDAAEREKSLLGLLLRGLVEYLPPSAPREEPAAVEAEAAPPIESAAPIETAVPPGISTEPEAALPMPKAASAPAPHAEIALDDETQAALDAKRREIGEAFGGFGRKNHFEVLGVPETASSAEIERAFERLTERFHPDAYQHPALADLRLELEAVYLRIEGAHEVLSRPESRAAYATELARRRARDTVAVQSSPAVTDPGLPATEEERVWLLEERIHRAERLLSEGNYFDAIQLLEGSIPLIQGKKQKPRAQVLLARAYIKNPNWLRRGEELLQKVVHDDPQNADAYFLLGTIYKASGRQSRAVGMFRKVQELKPGHKGAAAELSAGGAPLLKKLFGLGRR